MTEEKESDIEFGVIFRRNDCASFGLRLLAGAIDLLIAGIVLWIVLEVAVILVPQGDNSEGPIAVLSIVITWFFYFVILKYFGSRTVGYSLCGIRILSMKGCRPSLWTIAIRSLLGIFGPIHFVVDLVWLSNDPQCQALKDKITRTYVVKKRAKPLAEGKIVYIPYTILTMSLVFPEVEAPGEEMNRQHLDTDDK